MNVKIDITEFDTLVLRTSGLPMDKLFALQNDPEQLRLLFSDEAFLECILIASPALYYQSLKWINGEIGDKKKEGRILNSLLKYYVRMASRPTPFGKFSGCSAFSLNGRCGEEVDKVAATYSRLDCRFIFLLIKELLSNTFVRHHLGYRANTSLQDFHDKLSYVEHRMEKDKGWFALVGVDKSEYLNLVVNNARNYTAHKELAELVAAAGIDLQNAIEFIDLLIGEQILVPEIEISLTGTEHFSIVYDTLSRLVNLPVGDLEGPYSSFIVLFKQLGDIRQLIEEYDRSTSSAALSKLKSIQKKILELNIITAEEPFIQVDMRSPVKNITEPDQSLMTTIREGIYILNKIFDDDHMTYMEPFKEKFADRYEDKEVRLTDVLNVETGIGYRVADQSDDAAPLVDDIIISPPRSYQSSELRWTDVDTFLMKKYLEVVKTDAYELNITDEEVKEINIGSFDLPDTFSVVASVVNTNHQNNIFLHTVMGSSANNLIGRFFHIDRRIEQLAREIDAKEKAINGDRIIAEIVHLPANIKAGNVLKRAAHKEYEIVFMARPSVAPEKQILPGDLLISQRNNRLVVRSETLNKEIVPRLSNAHNFLTKTLALYNFLGDLQFQNTKRFMTFGWGSLRKNLLFRPRVVYKNVILSPASWNLEKKDYSDLLSRESSVSLDMMRSWRKHLKMPRCISIISRSEEFFIDLENPLFINLFLNEIRNEDRIVLQEFLYTPENGYVKTSEGAYVHEFLFSFYNARLLKEKTEQMKVPTLTPLPISKEERNFLPGSEWLYFKIYCGTSSADLILSDVVKPLVALCHQEQLIDCYFFIRYRDKDSHLRLRLHLKNKQALNAVIQHLHTLSAGFVSSKLIWKLEIDSYTRETERYGGRALMDLSEQLFFSDSDSTLTFIAAQYNKQPEDVNERWLYSLAAINGFMQSLGCNTRSKLWIMKYLKETFYKEFFINKKNIEQLDGKYRFYKAEIEQLLDQTNHSGTHQLIRDLVALRNRIMSPLTAEVQLHLKNSHNSMPDFVSNHIHMHVNRLFSSKQRKHELVIYDFLYRYYKSALARENSRQSKNVTLTHHAD